eukprot:1154714-Pyramimonas_sp.AAC.1
MVLSRFPGGSKSISGGVEDGVARPALTRSARAHVANPSLPHSSRTPGIGPHVTPRTAKRTGGPQLWR